MHYTVIYCIQLYSIILLINILYLVIKIQKQLTVWVSLCGASNGVTGPRLHTTSQSVSVEHHDTHWQVPGPDPPTDHIGL